MDLFYSRRISDPDAGAKITGKIGKNSIGLIAARNRPSDEEADPPHFGILRLKRDVGVNSSIGALAVGKDGAVAAKKYNGDSFNAGFDTGNRRDAAYTSDTGSTSREGCAAE